METNRIYNEDCIKGMKNIKDKTVDFILTDLPYGVTACKWDSIIPFNELWQEFNRILKDDGVVALTSVQPFTTSVIQSNSKHFKYCWYWVKNNCTGFTFAKYQPMRKVEDVCIFYNKSGRYHPQGLKRLDVTKPKIRRTNKGTIYDDNSLCKPYVQKYTNYPNNVLEFNGEHGLHPTQKPVTLFEYLIKTYTNVGDLVLDCCIGSGTTAVACLNTNRRYLGFETDKEVYNTAIDRVNKHMLSIDFKNKF